MSSGSAISNPLSCLSAQLAKGPKLRTLLAQTEKRLANLPRVTPKNEA